MEEQKVVPPGLPVPEHLSQEAQDVLSQPVDMSIANLPAPRSAEEWDERTAETSQMFGPIIQDLAAKSPISVASSEIAGVAVRELLPDSSVPLREGQILLNLHGGGYTSFGGDLCIMESIGPASAGFHVIAVDYRMPPHHPFPAAVEDGVAVYRALLEDYEPADIGVFGASAGGGLTAAVILAAREEGLPLPAAAVLNTPWSDLAKVGDSYFANEGVDPMLPSYSMLGPAAEIYAAGEPLDNPLISPVYADYTKGFPPSLLSTGTRDMLLSCTVRLHRRLRNAGIEAELHVFESMWHGFQLLVPTEGQELDNEIIGFWERHLGSK